MANSSSPGCQEAAGERTQDAPGGLNSHQQPTAQQAKQRGGGRRGENGLQLLTQQPKGCVWTWRGGWVGGATAIRVEHAAGGGLTIQGRGGSALSASAAGRSCCRTGSEPRLHPCRTDRHRREEKISCSDLYLVTGRKASRNSLQKRGGADQYERERGQTWSHSPAWLRAAGRGGYLSQGRHRPTPTWRRRPAPPARRPRWGWRSAPAAERAAPEAAAAAPSAP